MMKKYCLGVAAAIALTLAATSAQATVLHTTLGPGEAFNTGTRYSVAGFNYGDSVIASRFTVSSTAMLTNAMLGLNHLDGSNSPVDVYVESDAGGKPGSILASLTQVGTIPPIRSETLTMFNGSNITLTTGTTYWLVAVETDSNSGQGWDVAYFNPINSLAFGNTGSATGPWTESPEYDVAFEINGSSPVPESTSSFLLLGESLLGVGLVAFACRPRLNC